MAPSASLLGVTSDVVHCVKYGNAYPKNGATGLNGRRFRLQPEKTEHDD